MRQALSRARHCLLSLGASKKRPNGRIDAPTRVKEALREKLGRSHRFHGAALILGKLAILVAKPKEDGSFVDTGG